MLISMTSIQDPNYTPLTSDLCDSPVGVVGHSQDHQGSADAREDHHSPLVQHLGVWKLEV